MSKSSEKGPSGSSEQQRPQPGQEPAVRIDDLTPEAADGDQSDELRGGLRRQGDDSATMMQVDYTRPGEI